MTSHRDPDALSPEELRGALAAAERQSQELREALHQAEEESAELRFLLEKMGDFVYRHDRDGIFEYLSPTVEKVSGYTRAEWMRHYSTYMTDHPQNERVVEHTEESLRTGATRPPYLVQIRHKDGHPIFLELAEQPYFHDGEVAGLVGVAREVTERCRMQERLRQSDKLRAMGQLAGGVAHDFNNQLSGIQGFAEILVADLEDGVLRDYAESIFKAARHAARVTQQLLAFARKEEQQQEFLDLHRVVEEVAVLIRHTIDRRIEIRQDLTDDPALVRGDATRLQNVLLNLCLNAADAMPGGGRLTLRTRISHHHEDRTVEGEELPAGPYVHVAVEDTGHGMDEETRARVFEPFFTTKGAGQGTGLGLAAVYGTVRSHHGTVEVVSRPGEGTRFEIQLPAAEPPSHPPRPPVGSRPPRRSGPPRRVLVVDDEAAVRNLLRVLLERAGYRVTTGRDGTDAVAELRAEPGGFDLVVLDLEMPRMSGRDAFCTLRELAPTLPVLFCSGYSSEDRMRPLLEDHRCRFLPKPFDAIELMEEVQSLLTGTSPPPGTDP